MIQQSPRLALPYLAPSQAQKHVTHNEALKRLDRIVQLVLASVDAIAPPGIAEEGEIHALGPNPVDAWAGQGGRLAVRDGDGWAFVTPAQGWCACERDTGAVLRRDGQDWRPIPMETQQLEGVGIGTDWDGVNRLSVAADATLLSHDGAGHQIKINKATDSETASLLFQSDWTGHAEIGLAGDRALSLKLSDDGATWYEALRADPATGRIDLAPAGTVRLQLADAALQVDVPITGAAVQAESTDKTSGKLMKTGAFGLGGSAIKVADGHVYFGHSFFGQGDGSDSVNFPSSTDRYSPMLILNRDDSGEVEAHIHVGSQSTVRYTSNGGATWLDYVLYSRKNILGTVSQSAGTPTGAVIERGSNANGDYVRLADGTQICRRTVTISDLQITITNGVLFMSNELNYDLPITFVALDQVHSAAEVLFSNDYNIRARSISATMRSGYFSKPWEGIRVNNVQSIAATGTTTKLSLFAIGRWF